LCHFFPSFSIIDRQNIVEDSGSVPIIPDFSVPPPNIFPGYQPPTSVSAVPPPQKTAAEIEYEKKVAEFIQGPSKAPKKDDLDEKINKHLNQSTPPVKSGRKRRTFTDYPVVDVDAEPKPSGSGQGKYSKRDDIDLRMKISGAKIKTPEKPPAEKEKVVFNKSLGLYERMTSSSERIVKKLSKSPSPPERRRSRSPKRSSSRRSRSRSGDRSRRRRSRSRDRYHKRSRYLIKVILKKIVKPPID